MREIEKKDKFCKDKDFSKKIRHVYIEMTSIPWRETISYLGDFKSKKMSVKILLPSIA